MIVNQLSANTNAQAVNPQQQQNSQQQSLAAQYQTQQSNQNFLYQTAAAAQQQQQQTQLYHYQLLKTPPPPPPQLAFQTHQFTNIIPTDQNNFLSQINFATKQQQQQIDINNNFIANFSNEHQIYEYMHQLLEEKEKLKELYNEPYSFLLPISAKLLDEGKI
jgi:hypothetical protein